MKLRNKKTGEIIDVYKGQVLLHYSNGRKTIHFKSLEELDEWEDYEEPKEFWYIGQDGIIFSDVDTITLDYADRLASIGNYFETREEAEQTLEKLKAYKRLKDKGFRFTDYDYTTYNKKGCGQVFFNDVSDNINDIKADLDLVFGGKE